MSIRPRPGALYDDYLGTLPFWQGVKEAPPLEVILTGDDDAYDAWVVERWKQQYAAASDPSQTSAPVDAVPADRPASPSAPSPSAPSDLAASAPDRAVDVASTTNQPRSDGAG